MRGAFPFVPLRAALAACCFLSAERADAQSPAPASAGAPAVSSPSPVPDEEDILPPRAQVEIPVPPTVSYTPWIAAAAALTGGLVLWLWLRRPRRVQGPPPLEAALTELAALDRTRNQLEAAPLAEQAADIVRRFIAARHGIAAPARTSEEFLRALSESQGGLLAAQEPLLRRFLISCDMAKFAAAKFNAAERLALLEAADKFMREAGRATPPPPPAPPSPQGVEKAEPDATSQPPAAP